MSPAMRQTTRSLKASSTTRRCSSATRLDSEQAVGAGIAKKWHVSRAYRAWLPEDVREWTKRAGCFSVNFRSSA